MLFLFQITFFDFHYQNFYDIMQAESKKDVIYDETFNPV